jgi:hypothetical protein
MVHGITQPNGLTQAVGIFPHSECLLTYELSAEAKYRRLTFRLFAHWTDSLACLRPSFPRTDTQSYTMI